VISHTGIFLSETLGTGIMIFLGLSTSMQGWFRRQGAAAGAAGWALAVFTGASVADASGAHLNPAITLAQALAGRVDWVDVPAYLAGEGTGTLVGAVLAAFVFHHDVLGERNNDHLVGLFATLPLRPGHVRNVTTEALASGVLVAFVLCSPSASVHDGVYHFGNEGLGYAAVAMVIFVLTIGAGGPTSAAMNPFRDLGPRVVYTIIYRGSGMPSARWDYAWVPIAGPLIGSGLGVMASLLLSADG
jgi:glycerol uptake facilitator protein